MKWSLLCGLRSNMCPTMSYPSQTKPTKFVLGMSTPPCFSVGINYFSVFFKRRLLFFFFFFLSLRMKLFRGKNTLCSLFLLLFLFTLKYFESSAELCINLL